MRLGQVIGYAAVLGVSVAMFVFLGYMIEDPNDSHKKKKLASEVPATAGSAPGGVPGAAGAGLGGAGVAPGGGPGGAGGVPGGTAKRPSATGGAGGGMTAAAAAAAPGGAAGSATEGPAVNVQEFMGQVQQLAAVAQRAMESGDLGNAARAFLTAAARIDELESRSGGRLPAGDLGTFRLILMLSAGKALKNLGQLEQAEAQFDRVAHCTDKPDMAGEAQLRELVLEGRLFLAETHLQQGQLERVDAAIDGLRADFLAHWGLEHANYAVVTGCLGRLRMLQERHEDAEPMLRFAVDSFTGQTELGARHPLTISAVLRLAHTHHARGQFERANELVRGLIEAYRSGGAEHQADAMLFMFYLGLRLFDQEQFAAAQQSWESALSLLESVRGAGGLNLPELNSAVRFAQAGALWERAAAGRDGEDAGEALAKARAWWASLVADLKKGGLDKPPPGATSRLLRTIRCDLEPVSSAKPWSQEALPPADDPLQPQFAITLELSRHPVDGIKLAPGAVLQATFSAANTDVDADADKPSLAQSEPVVLDAESLVHSGKPAVPLVQQQQQAPLSKRSPADIQADGRAMPKQKLVLRAPVGDVPVTAPGVYQCEVRVWADDSRQELLGVHRQLFLNQVDPAQFPTVGPFLQWAKSDAGRKKLSGTVKDIGLADLHFG